MNICFICDTPYQLLNCINIYYHYNEESINLKENYADLYVGNHFYKCEEIANRLKESKVFNNVYLYDFPKYKNKIDFLISKFNEVFFIQKNLQVWTHKDNGFENNYDRIYMSIYTHFSFAVQEVNPSAKIYFYDDGVGTYLGNAQTTGFKKRKIIYKITNRKFPILKPDVTYVNNLEFYLELNNGKNEEIRQLPELNNRNGVFLELLCKIFDFETYKEYNRKNIIFLTQPNDNNIKDFDRTEKSILDILVKYRDKTLLRVHPRQSDIKYSQFNRDKERNLWELISLFQLKDNHILIGIFSTAQLIPKILYNKEPWLIFMYPLFKNAYTIDAIEMMERTIDILKKTYIKKDKVIVVSELRELNIVIDKIL